MDWKLKMTAFLIVALMLAVSAAPVAYASVENEAEETEYAASEDIYGWGSTDPISIGLNMVAGYLVGIYDWIKGLIDDKDDGDSGSAGDQEAIYQAMRKAYASNITYASDVTVSIVSSILPQDADLWFFTTDSWQKTIEYVVAENWFKDNEGYAEYMDSMMVRSGLPSNSANYLSNWNMTIDMTFDGLAQYSYKLGQNDYGKDMVYKIVIGDLEIEQDSAPQQDQLIMLDMTQFVKPTSSNKMVYIDADLTDYGKSHDFCKTIYVMGRNTVTIVNSNGHEYTLQPGMNDIVELGLTTGVYELSVNATYAGPFVPLGNSTAAEVSGGMVVKKGTELVYLMPSASGGLNVYDANGVSKGVASTMTLSVKYVGPDGEDTVSSVIVGKTSSGKAINIIQDYDNLVQQIAVVTESTNNAAQALWEIFDACEANNKYVKPSSLVINVPGYTISAAEYKAIYIQAMRQIAAYGTEHESELLSVVTNVESIGLYCYGNIYNNGKLWAENVVFTPYITTDNQTLKVGEMVAWGGEGFAMIWAKTSSYSEWDGKVSLSTATLTDLNTKFTLEISKMVRNGEEIDEITLERSEIQKIIDPYVPDTPDPVDPEDIKVLNAETLVMIIFLELAAILILLGILFGFNAFLIIAGIIVAIIAVLWPQTITALLLGNLTMKDLIPFGWAF